LSCYSTNQLLTNLSYLCFYVHKIIEGPFVAFVICCIIQLTLLFVVCCMHATKIIYCMLFTLALRVQRLSTLYVVIVYLLHAIYVLQQHFNVFTFALRVQRLSTLYVVIVYLLHAIYVLQQHFNVSLCSYCISTTFLIFFNFYFINSMH
jgi:hypothetical protein